MSTPVVQIDPEHVFTYSERIALRAGVPPEDAREIANDVLGAVLEYRSKITNLLGFIRLRTRRNMARRSQKWGRRQDAGVESPLTLEDVLEVPTEISDSEKIEIQVDVERALEKLPREAVELLLRHYVRGETEREIATDLKVSQPTIHERLVRVTQEFRRIYAEAA